VIKSLPAIEPAGLADLQGQCELNFLRLEQIFPDMRVTLQKHMTASRDNSLKLGILVAERAPYTTKLRIVGQVTGLPWAGSLQAEVHMYHDAKMAEVTHSHSKRLWNLHNRYPNALMLQRDEKWNTNQFLGVWLDYFLKCGQLAPETC
jgi:uncharacterized protein